jgi:hypothetical protein
MKTTLMSMTALSALALASPASAEPWTGSGQQTAELQQSIDAGIASGAISSNESGALRNDLRRLVTLEQRLSADGFTGRENATLRRRSAELRRQIATAERTDVRRDRRAAAADRRARNEAGRDRHAAAAEDRRADRRASEERRERHEAADDRRRDASEARSDRRDASEQRREADIRAASISRFSGAVPGDRFAGDVRIGQPASMRMVAMPERYRDEYRDGADFYYRWDDKRIYQLDRRTNLITGLLDTAG